MMMVRYTTQDIIRVLLAELPELARATTQKERVQHNIFPYKCNNLFIIYLDIVLHNFLWFIIDFIKFFDLICLFQTLKSDKSVFHRHTLLSRNFHNWVLMTSLLMTSPLLELCWQKGWRPGIVFQSFKISLSISIFGRQIFNNFVAAVIRETSILVIFNVFMKYYALISL